MQRSPHQLVLTLFVVAAAVMLAACSTAAEGISSGDEPVVVEEVEGTELSRLTLSESAAERLDIQTVLVEAASEGSVVPSAAVIIDPDGVYWVYANPDPFVFLRHEIRPVVEEGGQAFFVEGPDVGTAVVVIGVPELYGAEFGIGK